MHTLFTVAAVLRETKSRSTLKKCSSFPNHFDQPLFFNYKVSETFETIRMAKKNGFRTIVSHRSGETTDPFISDLAVAVQADFIKSGSVVRTERTSKYNQLLRIEQSLAQSTFTPSEEILLESI